MLPVLNTAQYECIIPSSGKKCKFRPFLVKEEKALLLAKISNDASTMITTLKEVIDVCTNRKLDMDKLATFDIEYLFCQIRGKSIGEVVDLQFKCGTCTAKEAVSSVKLDITKIKVKRSPQHTNKITLFNDVGVCMKYPGFDVISEIEKGEKDKKKDEFGAAINMIIDSIDYVYEGDEVTHAKDVTREEMEQFVNNLRSEEFMKLQDFFVTMPRMEQDVSYTCPVCGKTQNITLSGIQNFF